MIQKNIIFQIFFLLSIVYSTQIQAEVLDENDYTVGSGDVLEITVWAGEKKENNLSNEYLVFQSGVIEMPMLGSVLVENLSLENVSSVISIELGLKYIREPQVTSSVKEYGSKSISILGAVAKPGSFKLERRTTLADALAKSEGINVQEKGAKEIKITRLDGEKMVFNLEEVLEGIIDLEMKNGDRIYVTDGLFVIVNGRVEAPGTIPWRKGMTITEAIAEAGGALPAADLRKVYLLRAQERIPVDVKSILQGKDVDILLQDGDKVFLEERAF
jgi:polysaccharide export outer membrane protein